jgi:hypothetical protein
MPTEPTEQVDHRAEALKLLRQCDSAPDMETAAFYRQKALVHSNLAIAEAQERVAEQMERIAGRLESVTGVPADAPFGSGIRYLRVKR